MAPNRTKTVKNKHAANKSGIKNSKAAQRPEPDAFVKSRGGSSKKSTPPKTGHPSAVAELLRKRKQKKTYTEAQLGIPELNAIRPAGVVKPTGKKKGKVFVDDGESMRTILAIVQAEKDGKIESKIMKARQMEEIREARKAEAEKKDEERRARLEDVKDLMRKKRRRSNTKSDKERKPVGTRAENIRGLAMTGSRAGKLKPRKKVSFV